MIGARGWSRGQRSARRTTRRPRSTKRVPSTRRETCRSTALDHSSGLGGLRVGSVEGAHAVAGVGDRGGGDSDGDAAEQRGHGEARMEGYFAAGLRSLGGLRPNQPARDRGPAHSARCWRARRGGPVQPGPWLNALMERGWSSAEPIPPTVVPGCSNSHPQRERATTRRFRTRGVAFDRLAAPSVTGTPASSTLVNKSSCCPPPCNRSCPTSNVALSKMIIDHGPKPGLVLPGSWSAIRRLGA